MYKFITTRRIDKEYTRLKIPKLNAIDIYMYKSWHFVSFLLDMMLLLNKSQNIFDLRKHVLNKIIDQKKNIEK